MNKQYTTELHDTAAKYVTNGSAQHVSCTNTHVINIEIDSRRKHKIEAALYIAPVILLSPHDVNTRYTAL